MEQDEQEVKERPILFSGPMVRAILDGSKTVTRRIVSDEIAIDILTMIEEKGPLQILYSEWCEEDPDEGDGVHCPEWLAYDKAKDWVYPLGQGYGNIGDRLWVRETWAPFVRGDGNDGTIELIKFQADGFEKEWPHDKDYFVLGWHWRPSIHMRKDACRLRLEIVSVSIERLHDITNEDSVKEGIQKVSNHDQWFNYLHPKNAMPAQMWIHGARESFRTLWSKINGKESWDDNPWVWRIEFKKL